MGKKDLIAKVLDVTMLSRLLFAGRLFYGKNHIRVVNYHDTPVNEMENFEAQLRFYKRHYCPVSYGDLVAFIKTGKWDKPRPGLIISFDDGWRNNLDYAVPMLEKHGFKGWFFIPVGRIDADSQKQMNYVGKTDGRYKGTYADGRYLMSWEELKKLYNTHVLGCHTWTHHRMTINDTEEVLQKEIADARKYMEQMLGNRPINIFCWAGGEEHAYTRAAAQKIKEAGYTISFMTNTYPFTASQNPLQIHRTNIETRNSMALTRFQLSILMDMAYKSKRERVNRLTAV